MVHSVRRGASKFTGMARELTLGIIKPDAVKAGYSWKIMDMIEGAGFRVVAFKRVRLTREQAGAFYSVHRDKPFYESLVEFMSSGPVYVFVLEGERAVERFRELMGATDPAKAQEGTIRRRFGTSVQENAVHGSDSPENARREIAFFFSEKELMEVA